MQRRKDGCKNEAEILHRDKMRRRVSQRKKKSRKGAKAQRRNENLNLN